MKKLIVCALAALFVALVAPLAASAQSQNFAGKPRVEAGHSVTIDLLGLHYGYELPLWRTGTIIGRAGANFGVAWYNSRGGNWHFGAGESWGEYFIISPSIDIEPRWYYGLDRREKHGRSTAGNAGSFLSLHLQSRFPGYISDKGFDRENVTFFSPTWGLRRVWSDHWLFEYTMGVRFGVTHNGYWWKADDSGWATTGAEKALNRLTLNVRFGYAF